MKAFFKELLSWILYLCIWLGVLFVVYNWVAQPFQVDGSSMEHTLEDGERLWMWKLGKIDRFDVVIFPEPFQREEDPNRLYVKRVIGLPGDTIASKGDRLLINGKEMEEPYLEEKADEYKQGQGQFFTQDFDMTELTGEQVVPEGKLFVMGDNRRNSLDSRSFGFIDEEDVLGEATFIYWPLAEFGSLESYQLNEDQSDIVSK